MKMKNRHEFPWLEFVSLNETDSTNDQVHALASDREVLLVTADYQTKGRGQRGNSWESEPGKNLVFSMLIHPGYVASNEQFILSQAISLAIQQTLSGILKDNEVRIKWPNDIYWKDFKICGILIENSLMGRHIETSTLGVGININQEKFCSNAPNPVSLYQIMKQENDRTDILLQIVKRFHDYLELLKQKEKSEIVRCYFENLYRRDGYHKYRDQEGEFSACVTDIEPLGHLVLTDSEGRLRKYAFKEVAMVLPNCVI